MSLASDIAALEAILNRGASDISVDGTRAAYDLTAIERRLVELKRQQDPAVKPVASSIRLDSGF